MLFVVLFVIFNVYGCSTGKRYLNFLVLDFGHWSVHDDD